MQLLLDTGILSRVTRSYIPNEYLNPEVEPAPPPKPFTVVNVFAGMAVLAGCLALAGCILLIEIKMK